MPWASLRLQSATGARQVSFRLFLLSPLARLRRIFPEFASRTILRHERHTLHIRTRLVYIDEKTTERNQLQAMGSQTTAHGYASNSLGEGTTSSTWGETALGLFTEASDLDDEEQRNASVIPVVSSSAKKSLLYIYIYGFGLLTPANKPNAQWKATDVVLRVGVGCQNSPKFPRRCDAAGSNGTRPKDALRVCESSHCMTALREIMRGAQVLLLTSTAA